MCKALRAAIFLTVATFAVAAVYPRISLETLVDHSSVIVEGRVTRSWTAWDSEHRYIWTHYEVQVSDRLRGGGNTVTISEPGGRLEGVNMAVSGAQPYLADDHVLLFLFKTPLGYWRTLGGGQGKFTVSGDGRIASAARGMEVNGAQQGTPLSAVDQMLLAQFKALLRKMIQSRPAPKEDK